MKRSSSNGRLDQGQKKEQTTLARFFSSNSVAAESYQERSPKRIKCDVAEISTAALVTMSTEEAKEDKVNVEIKNYQHRAAQLTMGCALHAGMPNMWTDSG